MLTPSSSCQTDIFWPTFFINSSRSRAEFRDTGDRLGRKRHLANEFRAAQPALAAATCAECNVTILATHHDFAILPNGHLIVIADTQQVIGGVTVTGDVIIDLDQNHNPVWAWNEFNHLDINRRPYAVPDWTHTNAILYSPSDGDLIISIRHQNWLVKIDYDNGAGSGDIVWHLGYQGDFTLLNADGSADNNPADWFYAQHGPSFTTTNTNGKFSLVLFDNGDDRGVSVVTGGTCGVTGQPACYSTVPLLEPRRNGHDRNPGFQSDHAGLFVFRGQCRGAQQTATWSTTNVPHASGRKCAQFTKLPRLRRPRRCGKCRLPGNMLPCDAHSEPLSWRPMVEGSGPLDGLWCS